MRKGQSNSLFSPIRINAVEQYLCLVAEDVRDIHAALNENGKRLAETGNTSQKRPFRELKRSHEQEKIIQWLQYTDPSTNHDPACEMQTEAASMAPRNSRLRKTILSFVVVEHVKTICKRDPQCQYILYYFDFGNSRKQEVAGLLRSVLAQLASRNLETLKEVETLYKQNDCGNRQPDKKSLFGYIATSTAALFQNCSEKVNILVTSWEELDIKSVLDGLASSSIGIQQTAVDADIRICIKNCLAEDTRLKRWPSAVKEETEEALVRGAHGM
ncbi:MAG: hypothetical protein M1839_004196 [Geoglossum umbratile]|nr:MAG: hypothetical protein M1839_004196 [Geoglossum umbratile]